MAQEEKFQDDQNSAQAPSQEYLRPSDENLSTLKQSVEQSLPKRERIKHLLIGSPKAVISTIHFLQARGYAQVGDWSQLIPTDNPDEVMSILIRQIVVA